MDKRYTTCLFAAALLHFAFVFFFKFQQVMERREYERLLGVEYREEEKKKEEEKKEEEKKEEPKLQAPKDATVTLKDKFELRKIEERINEEDLRKLAEIARPLEIASPDLKIDIDKMLELHSTQIDVDLSQFEALDLAAGVNVDVIRLGKGISTQDILATDVVRLPAAAMLDAKVGLFTTPGVSGVDGERGGISVDKASASDISSQRDEMKKAVQKQETKVVADASAGKAEVAMEISASLRERLLSSPPPLYPDWAQKRGLSGTITIQLRIDENGQVTGMPIKILTTGYSEWDNMVETWIRRNWKWDRKAGVASGTITIRFIL